ncbi:proteinral transcription factor ii-i repeat domain-containing protein 2a [Trichonephila clavata]|uniref:Proteinral transcription factor ii-i repeat domain-containing protein 2a n=1 Tax=Trichonephila clavata TaxID=2740835 RepID=A0A8X6I6U6_TRICU|nr:proteinral transcription factor ii-i repeat domain-containing protein 2a [Trichonephila clavata]
MKRRLKSQQSSFTKLKTEQEAATRASFRVALEIAKRGKSFTDGEMIKECIIAVAEEMCPEKVNLLKTVSMSGNTVAFEGHTTESEFPIDFAIETLSALKINFDTRFSDFDAIANQIKIFQNPFDTDIEILAPELQMEMIDLQCSDIIKNKYQNSSLLEFYKSLPLTQFDNLHKFAHGLFSVFGTTYLCEKTFSKMKYTKNVYRSKLTDEHLKSLLIIGTSKISLQLQTIVSGKPQLHKSH